MVTFNMRLLGLMRILSMTLKDLDRVKTKILIESNRNRNEHSEFRIK